MHVEVAVFVLELDEGRRRVLGFFDCDRALALDGSRSFAAAAHFPSALGSKPNQKVWVWVSSMGVLRWRSMGPILRSGAGCWE